MTETLSTALEAAATAPEHATVFDLLDRMRPEIERALPATMRDGDRFARLVTTELRREPKLLDCSPQSLLGAMMLSAQLGLEPGPLGHVYLVPFGGEVVFIVGYRGYVELAYRSGQVKDVQAHLVHAGDSFRYSLGTSPKVEHVPLDAPGDREIVNAYAVARLRTGGTVFVVIYGEDWERARKASPAGAKNRGPWADHRPAMIRKTALRRLEPWLPKSPAFGVAMERDEAPAPPIADVEIEA